MTPALEMLTALIAFYTLTFLWFVLPEPELETVEEVHRHR
jgi:hypothetical protein